jgi:hypothetical protein
MLDRSAEDRPRMALRGRRVSSPGPDGERTLHGDGSSSRSEVPRKAVKQAARAKRGRSSS